MENFFGIEKHAGKVRKVLRPSDQSSVGSYCGHANRRGTQEEFKSCSSVWIAVTFATCSLGLSNQQTSKHHVWSRNKNFEMLQ